MTTHLESLAAAGCEFTAPKRGQKGPRVEGWPQIRLAPDDVQPHLAALLRTDSETAVAA